MYPNSDPFDDGVNCVKSQINTGNPYNWRLDLYGSNSCSNVIRQAYVDLTQPADSSSPNLGVIENSNFDLQVYNVYTLNGSSAEPGVLTFDMNGTRYHLEFDPKNFPGSTPLQADRVSNTEWGVQAPSGTIGDLRLDQVVHGQTIATHVGYYYITFNVTADQ
jgi:hypothetical protein